MVVLFCVLIVILMWLCEVMSVYTAILPGSPINTLLLDILEVFRFFPLIITLIDIFVI